MSLELIIPIAFGTIFAGIWLKVLWDSAMEEPSDTQLPPKPTCMICVQKDGDVESTYACTQLYGSRTYNYHMDCVVDAVCNPRKYEGYRVDYALQIVDAIAVKRKLEEARKIKTIQQALQRKSDCKKACKKIQDGDLFSS